MYNTFLKYPRPQVMRKIDFLKTPNLSSEISWRWTWNIDIMLWGSYNEALRFFVSIPTYDLFLRLLGNGWQSALRIQKGSDGWTIFWYHLFSPCWSGWRKSTPRKGWKTLWTEAYISCGMNHIYSYILSYKTWAEVFPWYVLIDWICYSIYR